MAKVTIGVGDRFRHYKGGRVYTIKSIALDANTLEPVYTYFDTAGLHTEDWCLTRSEFLKIMVVNDKDIPRFQKI